MLHLEYKYIVVVKDFSLYQTKIFAHRSICKHAILVVHCSLQNQEGGIEEEKHTWFMFSLCQELRKEGFILSPTIWTVICVWGGGV